LQCITVAKEAKPVKNNFARISKIVNTQSRMAGFTLIELLVAMSLTVIIVSITGFGLVAMMTKNSKAEAETLRRAELNRALDFIADEVRMANNVMASNVNVNVSSPPPPWAWTDLGGVVSPSDDKLYLQIPWQPVISMTNSGSITVNNHGLSNGNAVMFTGSGTMPTGLSTNKKYYVTDATTNTFNVSLTVNGLAIPLTSNSSGSLTVNKLVIYYTRDNMSIWLGPKTIYRSAGDCSASSNCDVLIDSIASKNGFTATAPSSRQVNLSLTAQTCVPPTSDNTCTNPQTTTVSTSSFARAALAPAPLPAPAP